MEGRPPMYDKNVLCINDLQREATKRLPKTYRDFYNEGATDMISLRDNVAAYDRYKIHPRVLVKVPEIDTSTTLFGTKVAFPLGFAPTALHKLAHPDGEIATSRAAAKSGIAMALSSYATTSLEDVAAQGSGQTPYAIQLTMPKDRRIAVRMIQRAEAAGYKAVFLTVDNPSLGIRYGQYRNKMVLPEGMAYPNLLSDGVIEDWSDVVYDNNISWDEAIPWLRSQTKMEIWVKGIYTPEDVELAIQHQVDGIIISNHGGRQLDGVPATVDVLRECAPIAAGRVPIAVDGGIRGGSPRRLQISSKRWLWVRSIALWDGFLSGDWRYYDGQEGVELAVKILLNELRVTMALAGCRNINEISRSHLATVDSSGVISKL